VTLVVDEADRVLLVPWGAGFFSFLRWLDDTHLRGDISILLIGGPVLALFRDPDDRGSPPLNTAELRFVDPLDHEAVTRLVSLADPAGEADGGQVDRVMNLGGGQAWLTTRLLAEVADGVPLDEASDLLFDRAVATFHAWERQLGAGGRELLRRIPDAGIPRGALRRPPWSRHREAARFGRCVGALRMDGDRLRPGPSLFLDWFSGRDGDELVWDVAISFASEDLALAREINAQLRDEFKVFFAPEQAAALWGTDLNRVLPNTYGEQSRYVLVLSTDHYVRKHWTRVEYEAVAATAPDRILMLDLGALPDDRPEGLVYRGTSPAELVGLLDALRRKIRR
jgi:hypothetical protein